MACKCQNVTTFRLTNKKKSKTTNPRRKNITTMKLPILKTTAHKSYVEIFRQRKENNFIGNKRLKQAENWSGPHQLYGKPDILVKETNNWCTWEAIRTLDLGNVISNFVCELFLLVGFLNSLYRPVSYFVYRSYAFFNFRYGGVSNTGWGIGYWDTNPLNCSKNNNKKTTSKKTITAKMTTDVKINNAHP